MMIVMMIVVWCDRTGACLVFLFTLSLYLPSERFISSFRYVILARDFDEAYKKCVKKAEKEFTFYST